MRCYAHLPDDDRNYICLLHAAGQSMGAIAKAPGRGKTTIFRELGCNVLPRRRYSPLHAARIQGAL